MKLPSIYLPVKNINSLLEYFYLVSLSDGSDHTHHIFPRCLGGNDDKNNLISLSLNTHALAHKVLAEAVPHKGIEYAAMMMTREKILSPLPHTDETKRKISRAKLGRKNSKEHNENIAKARFGTTHSKESKLKMLGRVPWNKGQKDRYSLEAKQKMGAKKGSSHHNYDEKIYLFIHKDGRIEEMTCLHFREKYEISRGSLQRVKSGTRVTVKGWKMLCLI